MPIVNQQQEICATSVDLDCVTEQRAIFDDLNIQDICDKYCPLECDSTLYTTTVSSAIYPTDYYWGIIKYQSNILSKATTLNTFTPSSFNPTRLPSTSTAYSTKNSSSSASATTNKPGSTTRGSLTSPNKQGPPGNSPKPPIVADDSMKSTILMLSVYYDDLRYSLIEESPAIDFQTLIGVIGIYFF